MIPGIFQQALIGAIRAYQCVSGTCSFNCCRFYPSCSQYSIDAISKYGVLKGAVKSLGRILRCCPLSQGGYDPVR